MPGGPQSLPPFLMTQKTMASLCPQWLQCEPLPATMAPFNPPPRATAPSLTACVRRALDTKGGVSRFSEHFTSIHQRRNKSNTTHTHPGHCRSWALPTPPKCNLFLVEAGTTLRFQITVQTGFQIISTFHERHLHKNGILLTP